MSLPSDAEHSESSVHQHMDVLCLIISCTQSPQAQSLPSCLCMMSRSSFEDSSFRVCQLCMDKYLRRGVQISLFRDELLSLRSVSNIHASLASVLHRPLTDEFNCGLFVRLHFTIGCYNRRRTSRCRHGFQFSGTKSFLLIMCIDAPESTTNSLSSGLRVDGAGRHLFSEGEKNAV